MSNLRLTNSKVSHGSSKGTALKRKLPTYGDEKVSSKENEPGPAVPIRTKKQKLSAKTPPPKVSENIGEKLAFYTCICLS